jgi:ATP-dependent Clp protease ATP-binding subunit ClpA
VNVMIMCSSCKEKMAVVFITKLTEGKHTQEGLCLGCAKDKGVGPINQILEQTGVTDEDIDELNKQVGNLFENIDLGSLGNFMSGTGDTQISNLKGQDEEEEDKRGGNESPEKGVFSEKENRNATKTKVQEKKNKKKKYLDLYGINITNRARNGEIDKVIGRDNEIERVVQILNRRTKNNPVLIGEPGVGKTAIAEGLALKIVEKKVSAKLFHCEVYVLDLTSIVAGTQFRGQFEGRMKGIIEEAKTLGNIILVIDELHNIMGAGEADGAMNAANIMKPALSRGEIQVIGATTLSEYRKYIEKDSALERRFQTVLVEEPSVQETIDILRGVRGYYEEYHKVKVPDEVICAAVTLSQRYITDRYLPDKAIDLLDEAGSKANLRNVTLMKLEVLKAELKTVQGEKESAISADSIEDYQKAADLKVNECKLLEEIEALEKKSKVIELTMEDIASVIQVWTKIPVKRINQTETERLNSLEERLHKKIIGQEKGVQSIAKAIRRTRADFRKEKKPASFIFVGPTGVGKTELVKTLAIELFETEDALIRLDMSEFMEKHAVSKLIGAPPGYVGYDEAGQLTEKIRRKPYSIILFDEIEKAHPDVFNMLLQILDDGRLTDSHGRVVSFKNTIIVMTSNAGTHFKSNGIGFNNNDYVALENRINGVLKETFRPEFLNRVDEIIVFTELVREELAQIVDLMLNEVLSEVQVKGMEIEITKAAKDFILDVGYDPKYGARPIRRAIQRNIEDQLAEKYLNGDFKEGCKIVIDCVEGKIVAN